MSNKIKPFTTNFDAGICLFIFEQILFKKILPMSIVTLSVIMGILVSFLSANYLDRYLNLDKPGGMYFCNNYYGCSSFTGTIVCESLCPTSRYTYCTWDLKEWDCFARMEFGLEITNATVLCSKYPYGNWVQVDSCRLSYDVTPNIKHSWLETTSVVEFWGVTSTFFGASTFLLMFLSVIKCN